MTTIATTMPGYSTAFSPDNLAERFAAIFEQYEQPLYHYVLRMMSGNTEEAQDLTQDAFVKAYTALPKMPADLKVKPWLYRIATNVCIDALRRKRLIKWQPWDRFLALFHPLQVSPDSPERQALQQEEREQVRQVFARLTPKHRRCLALREYQGLSYAEIARELETTPNTVKTLLYRAREAFRRHYRQLYPASALA